MKKTKVYIIDKLQTLRYNYNNCSFEDFNDEENQLIIDVIELLKATPVYICDGKACDECSKSECKHTFDVTHAINFKNVGDDFYEEQISNEVILEDRTKKINILVGFTSHKHYIMIANTVCASLEGYEVNWNKLRQIIKTPKCWIEFVNPSLPGVLKGRRPDYTYGLSDKEKEELVITNTNNEISLTDLIKMIETGVM